MKQRTIDQIVSPIATSDGAGVKMLRAIGTPTLDHLDPFLLLDCFGSEDGADYIAGFPDHPHRGFETVTYMLDGKMRHRDNAGNEGLLESGGAQWMTAGRGIVHSEMPEQTDGLMKGFQLWVNLPADQKMTAPRYQDLAPGDIPTSDLKGIGHLKVIAGEAFGVTGPVSEIVTKPLFIDLDMEANASVDIPIPAGQTAFLYIFEGKLHLDGETVETNRLVILEDGDVLSLQTGNQNGRFILLAADPINEPVARYGPFVMNTQQELQQAFDDFRAGKF
ncbi:pirin family protein [Terasakiella sp. A23]|uniref:pirin family protein n=1 Tax=Terasakiella sp. FCG-A23 TaxID=3080561 RepID=UPI0029532D44|nr:pirin family protein [Terasakiella sp. A23]MDV7339879.1 pirin family protein [Terasakiella sp. A23]